MNFVHQSATLTKPTSKCQKPHHQEYREPRRKHEETISSSGYHLYASDILLWLLQLPPHSPYRRYLQKTGQLIGRISWRSSKMQSRDLASFKTSRVISIHLPILQRTYSIQSQWALGQWAHMLRVTRIVPDTAPIFRLCATKDLTIIRQVFDAGLASPFDQTTSGITLLHVS